MYSVRRASDPQSPPPAFTPLQIEQRELSEALPGIVPREGPGGRPYAAARVLVRLHSRPLGTVDLPIPADELALRSAIEVEFGSGPRSPRSAEDSAQPALEQEPFAAW